MKRLKSILKYVLVILAAVVIFSFLIYPPKYVYRVMVWQDADYDDFEKFDYSLIRKSSHPFEFSEPLINQRSRMIRAFESIEGVGEMGSFLEKNRTYAFLVVKNDTLLYERYFNEFERDDLQTSFSVSKSILSLLVGMALQDGKIGSVTDPITNYIPELSEEDPRFSDITIADLLKMRSGIAYDSRISFPILNCDDPLTYYHTNLRKMVLEQVEITSQPNTGFKYNNYNPLLIGLALERALGEPVSDYFERELWHRIGASYDASWSTDEQGFEKMESGFNARPVDLAKLGRLLINDGTYKEQTVVSKAWLRESTTPYDTLTFRSGQKWGYSYLWWSVIADSTANQAFGNGRFGQFLYVSPDHKTVIVRHGLESDVMDDDDWTDLFQEFLDRHNGTY